MTTSTFRDYNADNPEFGEFSVNTSGDASPYVDSPTAVIIQTWDDGEGELGQRVEFDREAARHLGECLIAWTGSHAFALHAEHTFEGVVGSLTVTVIDGDAFLAVGNGPDFIVNDGEFTHDMGVRLIVWAGVAAETADA